MARKLTKKLKEFTGAGNVGGYHMGGIPVTFQKSSNMRKESGKKKKYYWGDTVNGAIKQSKKLRESVYRLFIEASGVLPKNIDKYKKYIDYIKRSYNISSNDSIRSGKFKGHPYYIPYFYQKAIALENKGSQNVTVDNNEYTIKIMADDRYLIPELTEYDENIVLEIDPTTKEFIGTYGYAILWIDKKTNKIEREKEIFEHREDAENAAIELIKKHGGKLDEAKDDIEDPYEQGNVDRESGTEDGKESDLIKGVESSKGEMDWLKKYMGSSEKEKMTGNKFEQKDFDIVIANADRHTLTKYPVVHRELAKDTKKQFKQKPKVDVWKQIKQANKNDK